ncbi:hypothetical protein [Halobacillus sp. K22]|uniref:hypothetical protein n=1 Tax=Halobacillus sp. K22 TaxID=3457431 RepID=UPI003FCECDCA
MMKLMFIMGALVIPVSLLFDQAATGLLMSLFFMLAAAYFSKPRFNRSKED